ncbi:MAG: (4Fe-4S)-binding protein [Planctomycetes bacterium]|nr:(4Fe-4S)-binding protein [Planctomycetota bacterium]
MRAKAKTVKSIKIDVDKCNGCRACEVICSSFHAAPRFSGVNPARARIRVIREPLADIYVPVFAGEYTAAECAGRDKYTIDGKEYEECAFCRASCPSRDLFKEPDSGLPLKCDMCESDPTLEEPWCVQWCLAKALVYEEREEEAAAAPEVEDLDVGIEAIANKHGWPKVLEAVNRMAKKA